MSDHDGCKTNSTKPPTPSLKLILQIPPIYYTANAVWLSLQAIPLFITPKLIIALLAPDGHHVTDPEIYLARLLSLTLLTLALLYIFSPVQYLTGILSIFHISTFVYIYTVYLTLSTSIRSYTPEGIINSSPNTTGLILGLIGYGKPH